MSNDKSGRILKKYEYTVNSSEYIDSMDTVLLKMDKKFRNEISNFYLKIEIVSKRLGLDSVGRAYLLRKLDDKAAYPSILNKEQKKRMDYLIRARFFDTALHFDTNYHIELKRCFDHEDCDEKSLDHWYGNLADQAFKLLNKEAYHLMIKANKYFLDLVKIYCRNLLSVSDKRSCLYFKQDIIRAIVDRDYRVSHHKVSNLLSSFLEIL